jgi:hypothetical protein
VLVACTVVVMAVLTNACDNVSCVVQVFIDEMLTLLLSYASVDSSDTRAILGAGIALLIQLGVSPNELNFFASSAQFARIMDAPIPLMVLTRWSILI